MVLVACSLWGNKDGFSNEPEFISSHKSFISPGEILKRNKHSECIALKSENTGDNGWRERTLEHKQRNRRTKAEMSRSENLPQEAQVANFQTWGRVRQGPKVKCVEIYISPQYTLQGTSCGCLCPTWSSVRKHVLLSSGPEEGCGGGGGVGTDKENQQTVKEAVGCVHQ